MKNSGPGILLSLAAALSLLMATALCCGYAGRFGPTLVTAQPAAPGVPQQIIYSLYLEEGRIAFWRETRLRTPVGMVPAPARGIYWEHRVEPPELRRCFWEFDAHSLGTRAVGATMLSNLYLIAFPIWLALLPCLVAPLLWLRKRRLPQPVGFSVITVET